MGPTSLELSVSVEDFVLAGEPLEVRAVVANGGEGRAAASVFDERDRRVSTARLQAHRLAIGRSSDRSPPARIESLWQGSVPLWPVWRQ